jgi:hypothetical protein
MQLQEAKTEQPGAAKKLTVVESFQVRVKHASEGRAPLVKVHKSVVVRITISNPFEQLPVGHLLAFLPEILPHILRRYSAISVRIKTAEDVLEDLHLVLLHRALRVKMPR